MNTPYIYFRGLKNVEHSVFCVENGQKTYYNSQFRRPQPFSSGQQVKRSILEQMMSILGSDLAPVEFRYKLDNANKPKEDIAVQPCDPSYPDQLLGGYMKAASQDTKDEKEENFVIKRRSPLSISALRPLHPLLANTNSEKGTFDRTENPQSTVALLDKNGKPLSMEDMEKKLKEIDKHLPKRKFLDEQVRASGLFVYDVAIDLRRLFAVSIISILQGEPEVYADVKKKLTDEGWQESNNQFGPCLVCPQDQREKIINALATALVDWRITSNQARTFSLMAPLAFAISDKAYAVAGAIRGDLREDTESDQAIPRIDHTAGAEVFVTPGISSFIKGESGSGDAIEKARQKLVGLMSAYIY